MEEKGAVGGHGDNHPNTPLFFEVRNFRPKKQQRPDLISEHGRQDETMNLIPNPICREGMGDHAQTKNKVQSISDKVERVEWNTRNK